jgi:hypothetical protein
MTADETRQLEKVLAELVATIRRKELDPLKARISALERDLQIERRLNAVEARAGIDSGSIAEKVFRGASVSDCEWRQFCDRLWPQRSLNGSSH